MQAFYMGSLIGALFAIVSAVSYDKNYALYLISIILFITWTLFALINIMIDAIES